MNMEHCCLTLLFPKLVERLNIFFFKYIFFLFIYGCVGSSFLCEGFLQLWQAGATLHRSARASHYRGLSCCGEQAPDAQAQQLWLTGLVAPRQCGIFPDQGSNPCPLHWQADSQPLCHQVSPERLNIFSHLLATQISSSLNCLCIYFVHFSIGVVCLAIIDFQEFYLCSGYQMSVIFVQLQISSSWCFL